jgi:hypothetical protein
LQTGTDVLNLEELKFPDEFSLSWYTDNLAAVIPAKYPPNRKHIRHPFHKILDRATQYHNDTRPPGVEEVTIYEQPAFKTTCRQLASLIPAEYFPAKGGDMVRFLEGVTGYTREKAGMNRYSCARTKPGCYINPTLAAEAPNPARAGTPSTRRTIKEEPDTDSTTGAGMTGYSEESAINLDPDDGDETILPLIESPQRSKQTQSKGSSKKSKTSPSSKPRNEVSENEIVENEVIEIEGVAQAAEGLSPQKSKSSPSKKRKHSQEDTIGVDDAQLTNAVTTVEARESSPASKKRSKKRKKSDEGVGGVDDTQTTEVVTIEKSKDSSAFKKRSNKRKKAEEAVEGADNTPSAEVVTPAKSTDSSATKNCSKKLQDNEEAAEIVLSRSIKPPSSKKRKGPPNEAAESEDDAQRIEFASARSTKPSATKKRKLPEEPAGIEGLADSNEHVSPKKAKKAKKPKSKQKKKDTPGISHTESARAQDSAESPKIHAPAESSSPLLRIKRKRKSLRQPEDSPSKDVSSETSIESSPSPDKEGASAIRTTVNENNSADGTVDETSSSDEDEDETPPVFVRRSADKLLIERLMADNRALVKKHEEEIAVIKQTETEERQRLMGGFKAEAEKHRREIVSLKSGITKLEERKQSLENLLYKGAGISPPDLETTLVRVEEGICHYRKSFQMVHKCEENKAKAQPKGRKSKTLGQQQ